jgi:inorganic triphosphatase YgiF
VHNIYCDTPAHTLRQQSVALRIRRIGGSAKPQWLQTLKTAGRCDSALSQRGEWEVPVASAKLSGDLSLTAAAGCVLREMLNQFTTNLNTLRHSDDPKLVHQARVGWRRFRSALRLFKPVLSVERMPSWEGLQPLLMTLSELRDVDVARLETLPQHADV